MLRPACHRAAPVANVVPTRGWRRRLSCGGDSLGHAADGRPRARGGYVRPAGSDRGSAELGLWCRMSSPVRAPLPDVTLVVIAFNERVHGPRCVRAILDQETDAWLDVVFVDDGSTDGTAEAVSAAAASDERFRVIRLPHNQGRGAARAVGVAAARGQAIGFVDADITLPPDWLARCLADLPGHAAVGGIPVPDGDSTVVSRISGATPRPVGGSTTITGSNVLFDAGVFTSFGFDPRDRLGEDFRLANRLLAAGHSLRRVPGLTVEHDESRSYAAGLRWRFANAVDASSHPRELRRVRLADLVWTAWLGAWVVAVVGAINRSPRWLILGLAASIAPGIMHAVSRFRPRPVGPFLLACILDVPLLIAYLVGRTVGIPRLIRGRR
jgi:Glycosyl transferase family 2